MRLSAVAEQARELHAQRRRDIVALKRIGDVGGKEALSLPQTGLHHY